MQPDAKSSVQWQKANSCLLCQGAEASAASGVAPVPDACRHSPLSRGKHTAELVVPLHVLGTLTCLCYRKRSIADELLELQEGAVQVLPSNKQDQ